MSNKDLIFGSGGGNNTNVVAPPPRAATEGGDNLNSTSTIELIDLIGEGEIAGFATPHRNGYTRDSNQWNNAMLKDIYINNTPLLKATASDVSPAESDFNFSNVSVSVRYGTQVQDPINANSTVGAASKEISVGVVVEKAVPIVKTIVDKNVNAVRVTITVAALQEINNYGDINGTELNYQIAVQYNGGGYITIVDEYVSGRTPDPYQRDHLIQLYGSAPVDIRVTRITDDSTSQRLSNTFQWTSYTEIISEKFSYPNSALVGIRASAEQFSSIPSRSYRVRGLKVRIPSNATVDLATGRLIYSGLWNGTMGAAQWTSDPAWCLYSLLTDDRYGLGNYVNEASLYKWTFYSASQYASELVSDGKGGYEPRFSLNGTVQTAEEAYTLINEMCSVMRVMPFWSAGELSISQDRPTDSFYLFTHANVTEEGFTYSSSDARTRPTVAIVSYLDLNTRDIAYEAVEDHEAMAKYGIETVEIKSFACTSQSQAKRLGKWLLYSNQYESEVVAFKASVEAGVLVRPGQVIEIADPLRAGERRGGRIVSSTTTTVVVDDPAGVPTGGGALSVIMPDGSVQTRNVSSVYESTVYLQTPLSGVPQPNSIWLYSDFSIQKTTWRVVSVQEEEGVAYAISAVSYNPSKYAAIEQDAPIQTRDTSNLTLIPQAPASLSIGETLYTYRDQIRSKVVIGWTNVPGVSEYRLYWRKDYGNWTELTTRSPGYEILDITPGFFEVEVFSQTPAFKLSTSSITGSLNAQGKAAPPNDVTGFHVLLDPDIGATLEWNPSLDLDLQGYEIWQGSQWGLGTKIGLFKTTSAKIGLLPSGTQSWWIKALDDSGVYSVNAVEATLVVSEPGAPAISGQFNGGDFVLNWSVVSGSLSTQYYEIRYGLTSDTWETATVLGRVQGTVFSTKVDWSGTKRFFVAAIDLNGNQGQHGSYDAQVLPPSQPVITQQVIDNNVLLRWNDCTETLPIESYELRSGEVWESATVIGTKQGGFTSVFETASGLYVYWLAGIDSAGNYGVPGAVSASVSQPPDYQLLLDIESDFSGSSSNVVVDDGILYPAIDTTETWQDHFSSRNWGTPQVQIDAGYPYYGTPTVSSSYYEEEVDYGTVVPGSKITLTPTIRVFSGGMTITPTISIKKLVGDSWTDYAGVSSVYATDFRYIKVRYDFSSTAGTDLLEMSSLNIRLDVKLRNDFGKGTAAAADSGGTDVSFNVDFIDVEAISVTPLTTSAVIAVYDFVDTPNPTGFKVLLFDTNGARVDGSFSWSARGV